MGWIHDDENGRDDGFHSAFEGGCAAAATPVATPPLTQAAALAAAQQQVESAQWALEQLRAVPPAAWEYLMRKAEGGDLRVLAILACEAAACLECGRWVVADDRTSEGVCWDCTTRQEAAEFLTDAKELTAQIPPNRLAAVLTAARAAIAAEDRDGHWVTGRPDPCAVYWTAEERLCVFCARAWRKTKK